jgi:tetratricopeptide (TPR) repeat protein
VQAAAWIPARGDLLLAFFSVISIFFLLRFDKNNKPFFLIFHFLSFVLALFSKETAVALPLVFLSFIVIGKKRQQLVRQVVPIIITWSVCIGIYLMIRSTAIGNAPKIAVQFLQLLSNWRVIPEMLAKFAFPFQLSPIPAFNSFFVVIGIVIILLIIGKALWSRQNPLPVFQGAFWFVVLNLPAMTFSNKASTGYDYLCHRGFLPLIGALIITVAVLPRKWHRSRIFWSCAVSVILIFLFITIPYEKIFSNPLDFYNTAVKTNPKSPIAFIGRGVLKSDMNDVQGAFMDYSRALQLCPTDQFALIYRANIEAQMGDTQSAFIDFSTLMHIYPKWPEPYLDRGKWRFGAGNLAGAKNDFESAIALNPEYPDAFNNLGSIYLMQSDTTAAESYYLKALSFDKYHIDALYNYGLIRLWKNDLPGACNAWKSAASCGSKRAQEALTNHCKN